MKEENVVPLFYPGPSVEAVLQDVTEQKDNLRSLVVTAVNKDGEVICWGSGHLEDVCAQALMIQDFARAKLRGEIEDEFPITDP
jgi:hypothetical protein